MDTSQLSLADAAAATGVAGLAPYVLQAELNGGIQAAADSHGLTADEIAAICLYTPKPFPWLLFMVKDICLVTALLFDYFLNLLPLLRSLWLEN